MPDQPDDAPKRNQRGVFPPFFAPRNGGRADSSPAPASGSWRRVTRLFTPPEGTRQRRTPSVQQTPFTPPPEPTPLVTFAPEAVVEAVPPAPEVVVEATLPAPEGVEATLPASEVVEEAIPAAPEAVVEAPGADALDAIAELAFGAGVDEFMVESLEPEPISIDPSDVARMDVSIESLDEILPPSAVETSTEPFVTDVTYDEMFAATVHEERDGVPFGPAHEELAGDAHAEPTYEELETVERYLAGAPAPVGEDDAADARDRDVFAEERPEVDPWVGSELPEPAFGSIGWLSTEPVRPSERAVDDVDEMSAALAWNDDEGTAAAGEHHTDQSEDDASHSGEDALSAVAGELRDSSAAWKRVGDQIVDEKADVAARAHFYAAPEPIATEAEVAAAAEADASGEEHAGAAIANALARVAARIRAGEVELPSEAVGASDESALAAALAALLRGPRH